VNAKLIAGAALLALAAGAAFVGSPEPVRGSDENIRALADEIEHEADHVTALELAQWIRERRPGLRVLDTRSDSEYREYHVPTAERFPLSAVPGARFAPNETLVLYSEGGAHAAQAWVLLRTAGVRNVYFLRGGLLEWMDMVMSPTSPSELTRYFGGVPRPSAVPIPQNTTEVVARVRRRSC
jgi:rhodanese-related sulfurtransferase